MESHKSFSEYLEIESELREYESLRTELECQNLNHNSKKLPKAQELQIQNIRSKRAKLSYHQQRMLEILPEEIEMLEAEIKELEKLLFSGSLSTQELQEKSLEFEDKKALCEEKITQYLELEELAKDKRIF